MIELEKVIEIIDDFINATITYNRLLAPELEKSFQKEVHGKHIVINIQKQYIDRKTNEYSESSGWNYGGVMISIKENLLKIVVHFDECAIDFFDLASIFKKGNYVGRDNAVTLTLNKIDDLKEFLLIFMQKELII